MSPDFYLPYLINYSQPVAEDIIIFSIGMLTAIIVSAEGQGFVATILGDVRKGASDRFHFNVFMHMSILGTLSFFIAGFGWAKQIDLDIGNFKKFPRLFLVLSRMAGPIANILMANIAASLSWILGRYGFEDKVFSAIVVVNVTMAVYGMITVAPLPGSAIVLAILPETSFFNRIKRIFSALGPYLLIGTFLIVRLSGWDGISNFFNPIVSTLTAFILDI